MKPKRAGGGYQQHIKRSHGARMAYLAAGHVCLALGILGFVLPVMPGVIFLIGAAACYARGSEKFYTWLLNNRWLGPPVREWEEHRAMTLRAKVISITMVLLGVGASIFFFVKLPWLRIVLGVMAAGVTLLILTINTYKPGRTGGRADG